MQAKKTGLIAQPCAADFDIHLVAEDKGTESDPQL
jgi:hypothetical protein